MNFKIENIPYKSNTILFIVVILGNFLLFVNGVKNINTNFLFSLITIFGYIISIKATNSIDLNLRLIPFFWLIKILITFFLLIKGWIPDLSESTNPNWGYDPQRYYSQSKELIDNNWIFLGGLNYIGILYYYGIIFFIFGHNPFAPAFLNCFFSLIAIILIIKLVYSLTFNPPKNYWKLAFLLLIPELLWFDVITSRESFIQFLIIISITLFIKLQKFNNNIINKVKYSILIFISIILIGAIRTSMLLPVFVTFIIFLIYFNKLKIIKNLFFYLPLLFTVILLFIYLNNLFQFSSFDINSSLSEIGNSENNIANNGIEYSNNSISQLLFPSNWFQAIVFVPFRIILYIISPLPAIGISFYGLIIGDSFSYQNLLVIPSSILNILYFPSIIALTVNSYKKNININYLYFTIPFWILIISISGGNLIIHERYRLMCSIFFMTCGILSHSILSKSHIRIYNYIWFMFLFIFSILYIGYKI
jgi:hypothetical protein